MKQLRLVAVGLLPLLALLVAPGPGGAGAAADSDGDGVPDAVDSCPSLAEDPDGASDLDGCPDTDLSVSAVTDAAYSVTVGAVQTRTVNLSIQNGNYPADVLVHVLAVSTLGACEVSLVAAPGDAALPLSTDEDGDTILETFYYLLEWEISLDAGDVYHATRDYEVVCSLPGEHSFEIQVDAVPWPPVEEEDVEDLPNVHKTFPIVTVTDGTGLDSDADGFSNSVEVLTGTLPNVACAATFAQDDEDPDAWPPDWDDTQMVDIIDLLPFKQHFGAPNPSDALYQARYDLNADGAVNITDLLPFKPFFNLSCV